MKKALVGIIMGSQSDFKIMTDAAKVLKEFRVDFELTIVSAHRTPQKMAEYATNAAKRGFKVIVAGAGGAAHLPGMVASHTTLPVIGVPIKSANSLEGLDSLLSIVQMPAGVPVATVAVNGAKNAGLLAVQILALSDKTLHSRFVRFKEELKVQVEESAKKLTRDDC